MLNFIRRHQTPVLIGFLVVLGLAAFWPSVSFDFVNWDDPAYIEHNPLIRNWSLKNLQGICTEVVTRNYAPLTIFSFLIDYTLWGMNPCGYHATNVLLHLINGILVFLLIRRLSESPFVGVFTAALFLIHPVQIESVVWISSRKGLLCSLFMLSALLVRMKQSVTSKADLWYVAFLTLALMSKAHAVVLPPIVLLYDILLRRQRFADAFARQLIPGFMALTLLLLTMGAQNTVLGGVRHHMELGLLQIMAIDVTILWQYIGMLFCPTDLCVMYDPPTTGIAMSVLAGTIGWGIVAFGLWRVRRSHPLYPLGALSFLLLLFPMLNFFRITTLMNDRYLYLPCLIVFAMTAGGVERLLSVVREPSLALLRLICASVKCGLTTCVLCACLVGTWNHLPVWTNSHSLWTHALTKYPDLPVFRIQYALTVHSSGQIREAIRLISLALLQCQPDELDRERMQRMVRTWQDELNRRSPLAIRSRQNSSDQN